MAELAFSCIALQTNCKILKSCPVPLLSRFWRRGGGGGGAGYDH